MPNATSSEAVFADAGVAAKFATYPPAARERLLALRRLILGTADRIEGIDAVVETLKWGEPAYRAVGARSGTTVRIDWKPAQPARYAIYFHCKTDLVETFRTMFPNEFVFEGNRAIVFDLDGDLAQDAVQTCIAAALTYRAKGKRRA